MRIFLDAFLITVAVGGFSLAFFIFKSKKGNKPMACPMDGHCEEVTHSEYSKFLGLPVEILGMVYYSVAALSYGFFLFRPDAANPVFVLVATAATMFAFLFSLYLTFIQAFNLKQWCAWCLTSAGLCSFVFIASFLSLKFGVLSIPSELFEEAREMFFAVHALSAAFGFGAAAVSALLFLNFVKDFKIVKTEYDTMNAVSQALWFALFIFILSGFGIYADGTNGIAESRLFVLKVAATFLILFIAAVFNLLLSPNMAKKTLAAGEAREKACSTGEVKLSVALNIISVFSWIFVFFVAVSFGV